MTRNFRATISELVIQFLFKRFFTKFDSLNERIDYNANAMVELQGRLDKIEDNSPRALQQLQLRYEADMRQMRNDWRTTIYAQQQAVLGAARALANHTTSPICVNSVLFHIAIPNIALTHPFRVLLPQALDAQARTGLAAWLDLGCGTGHWMQELTNAGVNPRGVDHRQATAGSYFGEAAIQIADELHAIQEQPSSNLAGVSAFDLLERISPQKVPQLIEAAWMALAPGGVLMLSAANTENLAVAAFGLWTTPERTRLWLPTVVADYAQSVGFTSSRILRWRMTDAGELFIHEDQLAPTYLHPHPNVDADQLIPLARNAPSHWALVVQKPV